MDHYKILGVPRTASSDDIQQAYHALAVKHHPDANPGDTSSAEKFKEINKAYQVLRHGAKRKEYDLTLGGGSGQRPSTTGPGPKPGPSADRTSTPTTGNPLRDILGDMMDSARATGAAETQASSDGAGGKGPPMVELKITTREALAGTVKTILVNNKPLRIKITILR